MGSRTTVRTNETSRNDPPSWAQPGLSELGGRITSIIPTMPGPRYGGDFIAPASGFEQGIPGRLTDTANFARGMTMPALGAMAQNQQGPSFGMTGGPQVGQFGGYDPTAIRPVIDSAMQPIFRQLREQVLPSLQSSAIESGAYGGNRAMDVLPGMAIADATRTAGELASGLAYQDFSDFQNRNLQAYGLDTERGLGTGNQLTQRLALFPDLLDTVMRTQTGATDIETQAASYDRALRQQEIDNTLAQFDYDVRYPFQGLDVAAALLGNLAAPWGTRTTTGSQTQSSGGLGQFLQGGMGLGMMAMGMPGGISSIFSGSSGNKFFGSNPLAGAIGM